jgi:hypothetical protein
MAASRPAEAGLVANQAAHVKTRFFTAAGVRVVRHFAK